VGPVLGLQGAGGGGAVRLGKCLKLFLLWVRVMGGRVMVCFVRWWGAGFAVLYLRYFTGWRGVSVGACFGLAIF